MSYVTQAELHVNSVKHFAWDTAQHTNKLTCGMSINWKVT